MPRDVWRMHESMRLKRDVGDPDMIDDMDEDGYVVIDTEEMQSRVFNAVEPYDPDDEIEWDEVEVDLPDVDSDSDSDIPVDGVRADDCANRDVDMDRFMSDIFRPGTNHITDGLRGGGKTHHAIAYSEAMVEGRFKGMGRVILLTNVIFVKRVSYEGDLEEQFAMETPPNVYHVTSMEQMFRLQAKLMKKYGREDVMFLLLLDEAQNFLLADEYQQDTSIAFIKFYGTTRKFNTCIWLLTPSINNLPPRARNFLDGDPAGYVNARWRKNKHLAARYIRDHGIVDSDPREFTQLKLGTDAIPVWFRVTTSPWTRSLEDLKVGEYGYDHLANADFKVSIYNDRPFDFSAFMERCSDMPSYKIASVMQSFFDEMDGTAGPSADAPKDDPVSESGAVIYRMRALGLKWNDIEYVTGIKRSTCYSRYDRYRVENGLMDPVNDAGSTKTPKGIDIAKRVVEDGSGYHKIVYGKEDSESPKGSPNPEKTPKNDDSEKNAVSEKSASASNFSDDDSTTLPSAPYIHNPTDAENSASSENFSENDPRTVDGRLTATKGSDTATERVGDEGMI